MSLSQDHIWMNNEKASFIQDKDTIKPLKHKVVSSLSLVMFIRRAAVVLTIAANYLLTLLFECILSLRLYLSILSVSMFHSQDTYLRQWSSPTPGGPWCSPGRSSPQAEAGWRSSGLVRRDTGRGPKQHPLPVSGLVTMHSPLSWCQLLWDSSGYHGDKRRDRKRVWVSFTQLGADMISPFIDYWIDRRRCIKQLWGLWSLHMIVNWIYLHFLIAGAFDDIMDIFSLFSDLQVNR